MAVSLSLEVLAACTPVLWLVYVLGLFGGAQVSSHPAEDFFFDGRSREEHAASIKDKSSSVYRRFRIAENQKEQLPVSWLIFLLAYLAGAHAVALTVCIGTFLSFRLLFIAFYLRSLQPWRTVSFLCGVLSTTAAAVLGAVGSFQSSEPSLLTQTLAVCAAFLWLLYMLGLVLGMDPNGHPPEDSAVGLGAERRQEYAALVADTSSSQFRWHRVGENQKEQLPMAVLVFLTAAQVGVHSDFLAGAIGTYTALRLLFVVFYLKALQPWRTLVFVLAQLTELVSAVLAAATVFQGKQTSLPLGVLALSLPVVLVLYFLGLVLGVNPYHHPAEDSSIGFDAQRREAYDKLAADHSSSQHRWSRIAENQKEQLPASMVVFLLAAVAGAHPQALAWCVATFVPSRLIFAAGYAYALQPWRSLAWVVGVVAVLVAAVLGAVAAVEGAQEA